MLTDENGDPIAADDPRLPSADDTRTLAERADALLAAIANAGVNPEPMVTVTAQIDSLVSLMVPPSGPVHDLFVHRVHEARVRTLERIADQIAEARSTSKLTIARDVPTDLKMRVQPPG